MSKKETGAGLDQYFTHTAHAEKFVEWCGICRGESVLEPSAGIGNLLRFIPRNAVLAIEKDQDAYDQMVGALGEYPSPGIEFRRADFSDIYGQLSGCPHYDIAIMNPPYGQGRDVKHLEMAALLCRRVCAIVRVNILCGKRAHDVLWSRYPVSRMAFLSRRPSFTGPDDSGHGARHDYMFIEIVPSRLDDGSIDENFRVETAIPEIEWLSLPAVGKRPVKP